MNNSNQESILRDESLLRDDLGRVQFQTAVCTSEKYFGHQQVRKSGCVTRNKLSITVIIDQVKNLPLKSQNLISKSFLNQ